MLRQFPATLTLYDRVLDINPNDPDAIALKARIYQAQGDLQEAARLLAEIDEQTPNADTFWIKVDQLRFERNYDEVVRLYQARLAQFHYASQLDKCEDQVWLAFAQRLAGDTAGAKATAEQARNVLEPHCGDTPDELRFLVWLSQAYAVMEQKDLALKMAERVITFWPRAKDPMVGPYHEEILVFIQTVVGDNTHAISTLTQLLQTPYDSFLYRPPPITPALLRLDPIWDPLRADPAFQKLCGEKQP